MADRTTVDRRSLPSHSVGSGDVVPAGVVRTLVDRTEAELTALGEELRVAEREALAAERRVVELSSRLHGPGAGGGAGAPGTAPAGDVVDVTAVDVGAADGRTTVVGRARVVDPGSPS